MRKILFGCMLIIFSINMTRGANRYWISILGGNWSSTANWSTSSGGLGGASVPGAGDIAFFPGGLANGTCTLDMSPTIAGINLTGFAGNIDLNGNNLTLTGTNAFNTGSFSNSGAAASIVLNTTGTTTFAGTTFNASITGTSGSVLFNGSTFNSSIDITKSNTTTDSGNGGNTFGASVTLRMSGTNSWRLADISADVFNGALTLVVDNTGSFSLARTAGTTQFNQNISIQYNALGTVAFGSNGGLSTLATGKTITVSSGASGAGDLTLNNFTQSGATSQTITLSGNTTAVLTLTSCTFNGAMTITAPAPILNTTTFNNTLSFTKTGPNETDERGGNVFNGISTFNNQGGDLMFGSTPGDAGDTWNANATFNNTGGNRIRVSEETSGNVFNANATFNAQGTSDVNNRIQVSRLTGGSTTFFGTTTFNNTGTDSDIQISYDPGTSTTFNGPVIFNSSVAGDVDFSIGTDGTVAINSTIQVNSTVDETISFASGAGSVTFGNSTISTGTFNAGTLRFQRFTHTGSTALSFSLTGTAMLRMGPSVTFNSSVNLDAPRVRLDGVTFNQAADLEKTGASDDTGDGGDVFNGATILTNSGSGSFELANTNPETFNSTLDATNSGTSRIQIGLSAVGTAFNGPVTLTYNGTNAFNTNFIISRNAGSTATFASTLTLNSNNGNSSSGIIIGNDGSATMQGNVYVSSTNSTGVIFCNNATGTATLVNGATINTTAAGSFTKGTLYLKKFHQVGTTAQSITLSGTSILRIASSSEFEADVNFIAPRVYLDGCRYDGASRFEKTGATDDSGAGGNTFVGATTFVNSGSGFFATATSSPDDFQSTATFTNSGSNYISVADNAAGSTFANNIIANSTSGLGVYFGNNAAGTTFLASGALITTGTFSAGELRLRRFTQLGSTPQTLTLTGTATLRVGTASTFNGNVDFAAPRMRLDGATFQGTARLEKTGATSDNGDGGSTFVGAATFVNSGSAPFVTGNVNPDIFMSTATFTNSGSSYLGVADNSTGSVFTNNVFVNCTSGSGVYFGNSSGGGTTLQSGATITAGTFTTGELRLRRFTQSGATAQNITLTGTAAIRLGPSSTFNGNIVVTAPQVYLDGATYNGTADITKNGATDNRGTGGNTFNATTTITNSGSGYLLTCDTGSDIYNGVTTLSATGTERIYMGHNMAATFNENIVVNSSSTAAGIYFSNNAGGSTTLAAGKTITIGATGFASGELRLLRFTQIGATAQTLTLTGSATFRVGPSSSFGGDLTVVAPGVELDGCTFSGTTDITKNGTSNNDGDGGNVFAGTTTMSVTGTGRLRTADQTADTYTGDVTFVRTNGSLQIAYVGTNAFSGNITTTSNSSTYPQFGVNGGVVRLTGTNAQTINKTSSAFPTIPLLVVDKGSNTITLATPITVSGSVTFTSGVINTTSANYLNIANDATVSGASNSSYVDGPTRKTGDDSFTFPVGDNGFYNPIAIAAPGVTTDAFTAQYFNATQSYGLNFASGIYTVSGCNYWVLDRTTGTSNVNVTLSWDENACGGAGSGYITDLSDLLVSRWDGTQWVNHGNGGTTGGTSSGTIITSAAVTSFSPFALASRSRANPLPIELQDFWASNVSETVTLNWITAQENNNDYFNVLRSLNGIDFYSIGKISSNGNSFKPMQYTFIDESPLPGRSYYQLKQTDIDGRSENFNIISVRRDGNDNFTVHPNPAGQEEIFFSEKSHVTIYNSVNEEIFKGESVDKFDVSKLASGVYLIKTYNGKYTRFVKK